MAESIGTAYINVEVNADQMQAGLSTARRSVSDLSATAQAEFNKASTSMKRAAESALHFRNNIGKSRAEQRAYNVEMKVGGALGREIAESIRAQDDAYRGMAASAAAAATGLGNSAMSARQLVQAQRQLPMQFTDIAVSLAAGQAPLMVLLQQGGQLKDTFGGAGAAMRAMGGYVAGLINPVTILAAAAGTLALAWQQSEDRMASLNKALILTGGHAGVTAGELAQLAAEMDELEGVTTGSATKALAAVAETGRFTAEQVKLVATAAENLRTAGVADIDATIAKFVELSKDPVDALLKLNETEHFLTETQIRRIRELVREGKEQAAATEAMRIYADVVTERSREVVETLGGIRGAWHDIKVSATEAWDAVVTGAGRADTALAGIQSSMAAARAEQPAFIRGMADQLSALASQYGILGFAIDRMVRGGGGAFSGVTSSTQSTAGESLYTPVDFSGVSSSSSTTAGRRASGGGGGANAANDDARAARELARAQAEAAREAQAFTAAQDDARRQLEDLRAEMDGPTAEALLNFSRVERELDMQVASGALTWEQYGEAMELVAQKRTAALADLTGAGKETMTEFGESAREMGREIQGALGDFLEQPFKDGLDSMGDSFAKFLQRLMAEYAASEIVKALGTWGNTNAGQGNFLANMASSLFGGMTTNAKGGVYPGATLDGFSGGVYNTPQFFAFAKGAGVFAEAGPEAIMPLSRGPDGKLGVSINGGSTADVNLKVEIINKGEGMKVERQETATGPDGQKVLRVMVNNIVKGGMASGEYDGALGQSFGLKRQGYANG